MNIYKNPINKNKKKGGVIAESFKLGLLGKNTKMKNKANSFRDIDHLEYYNYLYK